MSASAIHDFIALPSMNASPSGPTLSALANRESPSEFASAMQISMEGMASGDMASKERAEEARQAASQLVASTLILPVLQQLREGGLMPQEGPFAPTDAETRFGPLLDQEIADRITQATNFPLIDAVLAQYSVADVADNSAIAGLSQGALDVRA